PPRATSAARRRRASTSSTCATISRRSTGTRRRRARGCPRSSSSARARNTTKRCIGSSARSRLERTRPRRAPANTVRQRSPCAVERLTAYIHRHLWPDEAQGEPPVWIAAARYAYALVRDYLRGDLSLRAMSLVYTTMIAIVPLLALSFSMAIGFGLHEAMEDLLLRILTPVGENAADA